MVGRLTLGLYNSYDPRRFSEAHRRALVRAAPVALAFDANLATFGFPFEDLAEHHGRVVEQRSRREPRPDMPVRLRTPQEIATFFADSTSIGHAGSYFVRLADEGRFSVHDFPLKTFPSELGIVVLSTEHAKCPKDTSPRAIARELVDGKDFLLLMGLGPHGTPPEVAEMAEWELDVTGGNYGLETATAMGALLAAIRAHVEMMG